MHYPPETDGDEQARERFDADVNAGDTRIRWSVLDGPEVASSGVLKGDMLGVKHQPDKGTPWQIDVRLPAPVDVTLMNPDDRQRAYEVMAAIADGKTVTIHEDDEDGEETDSVKDPTEGGPWYVPRGRNTGHIVEDGDPLCGSEVDIRRAHVCVPLADANLAWDSRNLDGECGSCKRVWESRTPAHSFASEDQS